MGRRRGTEGGGRGGIKERGGKTTARRREKGRKAVVVSVCVCVRGGISSSNSGIQSNNYSTRWLHCEAKSCAAGFISSPTGTIVNVTRGEGEGEGGGVKDGTVGRW